MNQETEPGPILGHLSVEAMEGLASGLNRSAEKLDCLSSLLLQFTGSAGVANLLMGQLAQQLRDEARIANELLANVRVAAAEAVEEVVPDEGWERVREEAPDETDPPPAPPNRTVVVEDAPEPAADPNERRSILHLSDDELQQLRAAWEGGASVLELARRFRVPDTSIYSRINKQGWERKAANPPKLVTVAGLDPADGLTEKDLAEARGYLNKGWGAKALAEYFGGELTWWQGWCQRERQATGQVRHG